MADVVCGVDLVRNIGEYLREIHPRAASLQELSERFHVSPWHLQRQFKRVTGISPRQYAANLRLEDFKSQIRQGESVTDAIFAAGYGSSSRLYEQSDQRLGMTPSTYKKQGEGMTICYSVVPCALGQVLVAVTERGVCKVSLGDRADALLVGFQCGIRPRRAPAR